MRLPRSIASAVDNVARKTIGKDWNLYGALLNHWGEIVGEEYAQVTTPVKVSFPNGKISGDKWAQGQRTDGILHIKLPQGLAMEFSFLSEQIRQRINVCFGFHAIERIVLEPYYSSLKDGAGENAPRKTPNPDALLPKEINDIQDEGLRAALEALGKNIF